MQSICWYHFKVYKLVTLSKKWMFFHEIERFDLVIRWSKVCNTVLITWPVSHLTWRSHDWNFLNPFTVLTSSGLPSREKNDFRSCEIWSRGHFSRKWVDWKQIWPLIWPTCRSLLKLTNRCCNLQIVEALGNVS